jgi:hypothetical protein
LATTIQRPTSIGGRFHFRIPRYHAGCSADLHVPSRVGPAP